MWPDPSAKPDAEYYVYLYRDPVTMAPLYVGKGRGKRAYDHLRWSHNRKLRAFLSECSMKGWTVAPQIVQGGLTSAEARELERELIENMGRVNNGTGSLFSGTAHPGENSKKTPIVIDGVTHPSLAAASRAHGFKSWTLSSRLKMGWTLSQALGRSPPPPTPAPNPPGKSIVVVGRRFEKQADACRAFGVPWDNVKARLKIGWSVNDAYTTPIRSPRQPCDGALRRTIYRPVLPKQGCQT